MFVFTKENAYGLVRTAATFFYGWLLTLAPAVEGWLAEIGIGEGTFVTLFGIVLYEAVRWAAEKYPAVGNVLIFNKKPDYQLDKAA